MVMSSHSLPCAFWFPFPNFIKPKSTTSSSLSQIILLCSHSKLPFCSVLRRSQSRRHLARVSQCKAASESELSTASSLRLATASEVVRGFYDGINRRDLESVEGLISEGCIYEDLIFSKPFVSRKAIMDFFKKFTESISNELKFVIDDISSEDTSAIGVTWHLEWRARPFPFSRGCSFYRLEISGGTRKIIYARDSIEPAIKPGSAALDGCIVCPTTDSTFDLQTGVIKEWYPKNPVLRLLTPALRKLFVYPVKVYEENIYISIAGVTETGGFSEIVFSGKAQPGITSSDVNVDEVRMVVDEDSQGFGFTTKNELINGKAAVVGFLCLIDFELLTGKGLLKGTGILDFIHAISTTMNSS